MSATIINKPREQLKLAQQLYEQFHTQCFWHAPRDLIITEELIPFVAKGLCTYGGRQGFLLAANLQTPPRELPECR